MLADPPPDRSDRARRSLKRALASVPARAPASGITLLIYHRVGGKTVDELDLDTTSFRRQLDLLDGHDVLSLGDAVDRLEAGDDRPGFVLTFDDGFADVHQHAWPLLRARRLPFTIYLASAFVDRPMRWEGATATGAGGMGLSWSQLAEMVDSGWCTVGNHTHNHVPPHQLTEEEVDECSHIVERRLGVRPQHFTYPWGIAVPGMEDALRQRFRSVSTGDLGRNLPGDDLYRLRRVPVRRTDPESFFAAKLRGRLAPEKAYAAIVAGAKRVGLRA